MLFTAAYELLNFLDFYSLIIMLSDMIINYDIIDFLWTSEQESIYLIYLIIILFTPYHPPYLCKPKSEIPKNWVQLHIFNSIWNYIHVLCQNIYTLIWVLELHLVCFWILGNEAAGRSGPTREPHWQLCDPIELCSFSQGSRSG